MCTTQLKLNCSAKSKLHLRKYNNVKKITVYVHLEVEGNDLMFQPAADQIPTELYVFGAVRT